MLDLAAIMILGVGATWLAARLRIPSILLLLVFGFLAGPVLHVIQPDRVFGDALFDIISLAVAVILFEGGMQLKLRKVRQLRRAVFGLVFIGSLITLVLSVVLGQVVLGLSMRLSLLLGSILIVTGPTVVMPLLRNIRPAGRVGPLMRWEGIVNDPLGALLAFLVFEWIEAGHGTAGLGLQLLRLLMSVAGGGALGVAGAAALLFLLRRYMVPDYLQNAFSLMLAIAIFTLANVVAEESGLLAVTLMGFLLANQERVSVHHLIGFLEDLRVMLIGFLFILLSARIDLAVFEAVGWEALLFLVLSVVVVRPVAVFVSTLGSGLAYREKAMLAWMAPRGIVAAAVTSVFAMHLKPLGIDGADRLLPVVFILIVGTVALYGTTAKRVAVALGLAPRENDGVLFVGANALATALAGKLEAAGVKVGLVSNDMARVEAATALGLDAHHINVLSRRALEELDLSGLGHMVALTSDDLINALAILQWEELFGRSHVYHTPPGDDGDGYALQGRALGTPPTSYARMAAMFEAGATVEEIPVRTAGTIASLSVEMGAIIRPMFILERGHSLAVVTPDTPRLHPGQRVLALVAR